MSTTQCGYPLSSFHEYEDIISALSRNVLPLQLVCHVVRLITKKPWAAKKTTFSAPIDDIRIKLTTKIPLQCTIRSNITSYHIQDKLTKARHRCLDSHTIPLRVSYDMSDVINKLRPKQNGRHFPDDTFKCIFVEENVWVSIKISLKFVHKGPVNNMSALVQIMVWRRSGDKPISETMMVWFTDAGIYASLGLNELSESIVQGLGVF